MIILKGAPAAQRRIRLWIVALDGITPSNKNGESARKIINDVDQAANWTNALVYDADLEVHYLELTEAELAALASYDTISAAYVSASTRYVAEKAVILAGGIALEASLQKVLGLTLENHVEDDIVRDSDGYKTSCSIYLYDTAAHATTHDKVTGLLAKYNVTITYDANKRMTLYKAVEA